MTHNFNLNAYLTRIGASFHGGLTRETLAHIVARHTARIPFENLNPLLGWPVPLDIPSLERKLVFKRRGGYCFEHNHLLKAALEALGFSVTGLAARVMLNLDPDIVTPRTHMLLRVDTGGRTWIADAGFGGMTPTAPLLLYPGIEQPTPNETYRLQALAQQYTLEANLGGTWKPLYRFDLQPQSLPDYEVANWYVSTHPRSRFVRDLTAALAAPGVRYTLNNSEFTVRRNGGVERTKLAGPAQVREVLMHPFGIALPPTPDVDRVIERVLAQSQEAQVAA